MAARDVLVAAIIVFTLAIGFFIIFNVSNTVITKMIGISAINSSASAVKVLQGTQKMTNQLDYVIFGVFVGLVLSIIITGWFIGGNPIFAVIYFMISVMTVAFCTVLSNTWETATQSSIFGLTIASFPITNNIVLNLPIYIGIVSFLGLVVMFAKPYLSGSGGGVGEY
jgi:hypothetical protein